MFFSIIVLVLKIIEHVVVQKCKLLMYCIERRSYQVSADIQSKVQRTQIHHRNNNNLRILHKTDIDNKANQSSIHIQYLPAVTFYDGSAEQKIPINLSAFFF